MSDLFARAGTEIRDENGKLVATIVRDVFRSEVAKASDFVLPDGSNPETGSPMPKAVTDFINRIAEGQAS